jgi:hypothetical protein
MNLLPNKKTAFVAVISSLFTSAAALAQSAGSPDDAQSAAYQSGRAVGGGLAVVIELAVIVLVIIGMWKVFAKAGRPGWASIIPIYNAYVLCEIAGKPGWWVVLMLIPFVNLIIGIIVMIGLAEKFGKGAGFGIGLILLGFVFIPILGFGDATYQGSRA